MRMVLGLMMLCAGIAIAADTKSAPDFIPLSELEAARLETTRLKVQIVNSEIAMLRERAAKAQNVDLDKYDFVFDKGGFVRKGSMPLTPAPGPQP